MTQSTMTGRSTVTSPGALVLCYALVDSTPILMRIGVVQVLLALVTSCGIGPLAAWLLDQSRTLPRRVPVAIAMIGSGLRWPTVVRWCSSGACWQPDCYISDLSR